jgi:hypothetical protein
MLGRENSRRRVARAGSQMAETTINMVDALRGQQAQLRRLTAQKGLIRSAPKSTLSDMQAQVTELQRLLAELEGIIKDQLQRNDQ